MKIIIQHLKAQGAIDVDAKVEQLKAACLLKSDHPTAREMAGILVAMTAPLGVDAADHVVKHMHLNNGADTLGGVLQGIFEMEPASVNVAQITVCHNVPWVTVEYLDGNLDEFTGPDFKPQPIRVQTVISGGMVGLLSMKLHEAEISGKLTTHVCRCEGSQRDTGNRQG